MISFTLRAIGVIAGLQTVDLIEGLAIPIADILELVGLKATTPQQAAG